MKRILFLCLLAVSATVAEHFSIENARSIVITSGGAIKVSVIKKNQPIILISGFPKSELKTLQSTSVHCRIIGTHRAANAGQFKFHTEHSISIHDG